MIWVRAWASGQGLPDPAIRQNLAIYNSLSVRRRVRLGMNLGRFSGSDAYKTYKTRYCRFCRRAPRRIRQDMGLRFPIQPPAPLQRTASLGKFPSRWWLHRTSGIFSGSRGGSHRGRSPSTVTSRRPASTSKRLLGRQLPLKLPFNCAGFPLMLVSSTHRDRPLPQRGSPARSSPMPPPPPRCATPARAGSPPGSCW